MIEINTGNSAQSIRIGFTDQRLTAYGGMAVWSAFLRKRQVRQQLQPFLPQTPTSPYAYDPTDVALGLMGGILSGADKLSRVAYLRSDPAIAEVYLRVVNMMDPPARLMTPGTMIRVVRAGGRARRAHGVLLTMDDSTRFCCP